MFNFKEEIAKYRKSLEATELSGGVSGDEVRDILDIAKELVNARAAGFEPMAVEPQREPVITKEPAREETEETETEKQEVEPQPEVLFVEAENAVARENDTQEISSPEQMKTSGGVEV